MLQVKQALLQPLTARGYCLPHSFCFGQAEDKNEENKTCPCNTPRGRRAREQSPGFILFVTVTSLLSNVAFVLTQLAPSPSPTPPQRPTRYQEEISLVMDNLVEGEVREQIGSFQHLRKIYTHVHTFLNYPFSYLHYSPERVTALSLRYVEYAESSFVCSVLSQVRDLSI